MNRFLSIRQIDKVSKKLHEIAVIRFQKIVIESINEINEEIQIEAMLSYVGN